MDEAEREQAHKKESCPHSPSSGAKEIKFDHEPTAVEPTDA